ncbi:polysaccharide deacetylase family protein [Litoribacter populi]|uniref:polysaccharide deacetylase family protein n=1 Tax=Litoribacter populi TaxID=2598460 RepID=UPI00117CBD1B|nr:polysaccharide deacetylase family protein [Litoribacter populi]
MFHKPLLVLFFSFIISISWSQNHEVCFTFDDLTFVPYSHQDIGFQQMMTAKLLETLKENDIPAIGFVNETKLYQEGSLDEQRVGLLKEWLAQGFELGNHTFSHANYHQVGFEKYTQDILQGERVAKPLLEEFGRHYKYFRHPYLRIGRSKAAHDSLNLFLASHGYQEAPVTIDNEDYLFAAAYDKALASEDEGLQSKVGSAYIRYMEKKLLYYQQMSNKLFDRNIKQILLLHANALNADFLDALAEMYRQNGYTFISLEEALEDPAFNTPISKYGDWGISWLDRWALSLGKGGEFFEGDPRTPRFIRDLLK